MTPHPATPSVAASIPAEHFERIAAFILKHLKAAREQGAGAENRRALDAVQYLVNAAAAFSHLLHQLPVPADPVQHTVLRAREAEAWETLRHTARQWQEYPDYDLLFSLTPQELPTIPNTTPGR
ncbi:hypothetical protein [Streptomyces triculaminicus]|uniref:hypothetical protein n=1 Tax=Streptomyces triculaminicus TaxID=2816232 RepID=UPI0037D55E3B